MTKSIVDEGPCLPAATIDISGRKRLALRIPSVGVECVVQQVSVGVVARATERVTIRAGTVAGQPGNRTTLRDIAEWIVGERLRPNRAAVGVGDATEVVGAV